MQTTNESIHRDDERVANPQERCDGDWPSRLDLLPVPGREAEANHVLLSVALPLAQLLYPLSQRAKEFLFGYHALGCRIPRAETPRAD